MKRFIYTILMLMLPLMVGAQKITLGSAKTNALSIRMVTVTKVNT